MFTPSDIFAAKCSRAAYDDNCSEGLFFREGAHECWVYETSKEVYVAFRGTDSLRDMMTNLCTHPLYVPGAFVHFGFYDAVVSLMEKITPTLESARSVNKPVIATGHSQGGSLAILAGYLYPGEFQEVIAIAPAPCIRTKTYPIPIKAICHGADPVPRIRFLGIFKHCYETVWLSKRQPYVYGIFTCIARLIKSQFSNFRFHRIDNYINSIEKDGATYEQRPKY